MPDRINERTELKRHLVANGKSVLMLAPRRIGKTWTMRRFEEDAENDSFDAIMYDAEQAATEEEFYRQLNREIEKKQPITANLRANALERFKGIVSGDHKDSDIAKILGGLPPKQLSEAYIEQLNERENPTVILIDEIAIFALRLHRIDPDRLELFLSELRALRQRYPNVRWFLTGSIGLDWVARSAEVEGTLNDLLPYQFHPFSQDSARKFIDQLVENGSTFKQFELETSAFDYLVAELGWLSPYYLEAIAGKIDPTGAEKPDGRRNANTADVEKAFAELLMTQNRVYFASWREHISKNFPSPLKEALHAILEACARSPEGEEFDTLLISAARHQAAASRQDVRDYLDILVNDGYLVEVEATHRFRFSSGLLRRWWLRWMCDEETSSVETS